MATNIIFVFNVAHTAARSGTRSKTRSKKWSARTQPPRQSVKALLKVIPAVQKRYPESPVHFTEKQS